MHPALGQLRGCQTLVQRGGNPATWELPTHSWGKRQLCTQQARPSLGSLLKSQLVGPEPAQPQSSVPLWAGSQGQAVPPLAGSTPAQSKERAGCALGCLFPVESALVGQIFFLTLNEFAQN